MGGASGICCPEIEFIGATLQVASPVGGNTMQQVGTSVSMQGSFTARLDQLGLPLLVAPTVMSISGPSIDVHCGTECMQSVVADSIDFA